VIPRLIALSNNHTPPGTEAQIGQGGKMKRYECVSGYTIDNDGEYEIGELIPGIGEVQSIEDVDEIDLTPAMTPEEVKEAMSGPENDSKAIARALKSAASIMGSKGGKAKSQAKTQACSENGKKGGWPKGKPRGSRTAGGKAQTGAIWPEKELRCPDCGNIGHERLEKYQKYSKHLKCKSCGKEFLHVAFQTKREDIEPPTTSKRCLDIKLKKSPFVNLENYSIKDCCDSIKDFSREFTEKDLPF